MAKYKDEKHLNQSNAIKFTVAYAPGYKAPNGEALPRIEQSHEQKAGAMSKDRSKNTSTADSSAEDAEVARPLQRVAAAGLNREADALQSTADDLAEHGYSSEAMEYRALASTIRKMAERAA